MMEQELSNVKVLLLDLLIAFVMVPAYLLVTISNCMVVSMGHNIMRVPDTGISLPAGHDVL